MTSLHTLQAAYPHFEPLPVEFYRTEPTASNVRRRCKIMVLNLTLRECVQYRERPQAHRHTLLFALERSCYNAACDACIAAHVRAGWESAAFVIRYEQVVFECANDLDARENPELARRVATGELAVAQFERLTAKQRAPPRDARLATHVAMRIATQVTKKTTRAYTCPTCAHNECWVQHVQLRGIDEAKSTRVTCATCDHVWISEL